MHVVVALDYQKLIDFNGRGTSNKYGSIYALNNILQFLFRKNFHFC